jgi:hypothetical protein
LLESLAALPVLSQHLDLPVLDLLLDGGELGVDPTGKALEL